MSSSSRRPSSSLPLTAETLKVLARTDSFNQNMRDSSSKKKPTRRSTQSSGTSMTFSIAFNTSTRGSGHHVNVANFPPSDIISKKNWDGQKLCSKNDQVREAFMNYIQNMTWMEKISIALLEQAVKRRRTQDIHEVMVSEYSIYPRSRNSSHDSRDREEITSTMRRVTQLKIRDGVDQAMNKKDFIETCFTSDELKYLLLVTIWPIFAESSEYLSITTGSEPFICYEDDEDHIDIDPTGPTAADNSEPPPPASPNSNKKSAMNREHDAEKTKRVKDIYYQTAKTFSNLELLATLKAGNWCDRVLIILENLRLPLTIASADRKTPSFPLIFVNQAFEKMTQYSRDEALGRPCKFLQCDRTELDQVGKISEALGKGEGFKVAITNARKDGSEFLNFLAIRPVHNAQHTMSHVLAVQYDITQEAASLKEIKMVEDALALLCNMLKC